MACAGVGQRFVLGPFDAFGTSSLEALDDVRPEWLDRFAMSDCIGNLENVSLGSVVERHLARLKKIDAVGEPHAVGVDGIVVRAVEIDVSEFWEFVALHCK